MKKHALIILVLNFIAGTALTEQKLNPALDRLTVSPNSFQGTDSERINAAIRVASKDGLRVVVPRQNKTNSSKKDIWLLDSAILVQDNTVLELNNCHIKLSDRCRDNMIRSANCGLGAGEIKPIKNVHIQGVGNVVLEGAERPRATGDSGKALGKRTYGTDAGVEGESQTGDWRNIGILFAFVDHFSIENLHIKDSHCWAISLERCGFGRVRDIHFTSEGFKMIDGGRATILNQDGLDLRLGCHDISIEGLTGHAGDDLLALTGLSGKGSITGSDTSTMVSASCMREGGVDDIRNVFIQNVRAKCSGGHGIIRLLNQDGVKIYNIIVRDIIDTSSGKEPRVRAAIRIGDTGYSSTRRSQMGEMFNITVDTVMTRGKTAVLIKGPLKNSVIRNIHGFDGCTNLVRKTAPVEGVKIDN